MQIFLDILQIITAVGAKSGIELLSGMEIFATEDLPMLIKDESVIPINNTNYFLVEFDFREALDFADFIVERMLNIGAFPVIAHAERYTFVQEYPDILKKWLKKGCAVQVNKGSFMGRFGKRAYSTAYRLIDSGFVSAVASDMHGTDFRTPDLSAAYSRLLQDYSDEYLKRLFSINPGRICTGKPVESIDTDFGI